MAVRISPLAALAVFALVVVAAGLVLYLVVRQSMAQGVHGNLQAVAQLKSGQVEEWLRHQRQDAELALATPLFTDELQRWLKGGSRDERLRTRLRGYLESVTRSAGYFNINVRSAQDGALLLTSTGHADSVPERTDAMAAASEMRTFIDDLHELPGVPARLCIDFFFPITAQGKLLFVADIEANPMQSLFAPLKLWPGMSPTAETMLVRAEGDNVVYLSDLRKRSGAALHLRQPADGPELVAGLAVRGHRGALTGIDYRGKPVLAYALPVAGTSWVLLTKIDQAEAYAPLNALAMATAAVAAVMLLLAAVWIVERDRRVKRRAQERKRMDEELQASEKRFRQAFEHAPIGMAMLDLDGRFLASNPANCRLLGYSEDELAGRPIAELTHPEDRKRDAEWLASLASSAEEPCLVEKRGLRKDGGVIDLLVCRTLVRDTDGEPLYCVSQIQDVTGRNAALARIQRLSRIKTAISEINRAIIHNHAPAEVFAIVCRACVEQAGFRLAWIGLADAERQQIVPMAMAGAATGYLEDIVISTEADAAEGRGPTAVAYREQRVFICNDFADNPTTGPWRERALTHGLGSSIALPLERGGRPYGTLTAYGPEANFFDEEAIALLRDMADNVSFALNQFDRETMRRRYEEDLRRSEQKFRTLVESLPQKIFLKDANLAYVTCNRHYALDLGIEPEAIAGKTDYDFYGAELAEKYRRDDRQVIATGRVAEMQEEYVRDGEHAFVHTVKAPVKNGRGEIVGVLGVFWDITAAKRAEMRLEELSHRLVAVQEDERRRLAAQLHDRLTPNLAAVKIILATLGVSLSGEVRDSIIAHIEDAEALLDHTSADVRDIGAELRPTLLDYSGLIAALHGYAIQFTKRTGVAVHLRTPADGTRLDAEVESTLFRIAQEALTNCARHACAKNVAIDLAVGADVVSLNIKDDGFGFDAEAIGRRGDTPGLGLITMKERAEFAGGRFVLNALPLEGTEIRVELDNGGRPGPDAISSSLPSQGRAAA